MLIAYISYLYDLWLRVIKSENIANSALAQVLFVCFCFCFCFVLFVCLFVWFGLFCFVLFCFVFKGPVKKQMVYTWVAISVFSSSPLVFRVVVKTSSWTSVPNSNFSTPELRSIGKKWSLCLACQRLMLNNLNNQNRFLQRIATVKWNLLVHPRLVFSMQLLWIVFVLV